MPVVGIVSRVALTSVASPTCRDLSELAWASRLSASARAIRVAKACFETTYPAITPVLQGERSRSSPRDERQMLPGISLMLSAVDMPIVPRCSSHNTGEERCILVLLEEAKAEQATCVRDFQGPEGEARSVGSVIGQEEQTKKGGKESISACPLVSPVSPLLCIAPKDPAAV